MKSKFSHFFIVSLTIGFILFPVSGKNSVTFADEGMWTFDNPPLKQLKERYGFVPTQEWLDHIRLSSVRFMDGGSGSFVSPKGLVLTNHHVAVGQLQKISTAERDYVSTGFLASSLEEELKSPDLEVNILVSMENVTDRVKAAVKEGMTDAEALQARRAVRAEIEKESLDKTGLRSDVISLYHGGEYWLYRYKKYTDVRLVMAPERQAAYFGGDFDNFTYPRYDLDMAFFRVYENDKPIDSEHYLRWNAEGVGDGELVFVSGNPGSSDRGYTYSRLEFQRNLYYPTILGFIEKYIHVMREYAERGPEQERRALVRIFGLENGKKALTGEYQGLKDKDLMAKRKKEEDEFRKMVAENPEWSTQYGDAWDTIAKLLEKSSATFKERFFRRLTGSRMAGFANNIVRYVVEVQKPDAERLPGYHDSELEELRFYLFSPAPVFKDMEEMMVASSLKWALDELGAEDEFLTIVLEGEGPEETADSLITNSKLDDAEFRKSLIEGGEDTVRKSDRPVLRRMEKQPTRMPHSLFAYPLVPPQVIP